MQAITAVIVGTMASGVAGGIVGAAVGRFSPSFVEWIYTSGLRNPPKGFDPTEFAFGLGVVSGLFFGAGASVFLATVIAARDAWLLRSGIVVGRGVGETLEVGSRASMSP
jgi:hypothetical protein